MLEKLAQEHEIARLILKYREVQKLQSTYVDGIRPLVKGDIIHTTYYQTMTTVSYTHLSQGIDALGGSSETFYGKNKGRSIESKLKMWTIICLAVLAVLAIIFFILQIPAIWGDVTSA